MMYRKLLITGCGRSGTRYITFLLRRLGMDIGHEKIGKEGIASWCTAVDAASAPWGESFANIQFEHVLHQVRHPLDVISSVASFQESSWEYIYRFIPCSEDDPVILRSAKYWYYWNLEAEKKAHWRYQVEMLPDIYNAFCQRLGIPIEDSVLPSIPTDINTRKYGRLIHLHDELLERLFVSNVNILRNPLKKLRPDRKPPPLSWAQLEKVDRRIYQKVREKANEYGYST